MSLMDELSAARRVLARMGPEAFLSALDEADRQALTDAFLKRVDDEPGAFAWALTYGQRQLLRQFLRTAIEAGCHNDKCRERNNGSDFCGDHATEAIRAAATRLREIEAARPRRSLTPGPNGCCYRSADGVACPNTGTENVGGVAACDAHARQLPGAAERRSMRPYT